MLRLIADRIVNGAKLGDLSIKHPTQFTLVVNQRSAKLLGLSLPEAILYALTTSSNERTRSIFRLNVLNSLACAPQPRRPC
jgi:ABC-type uncharacterized transport system substrate-binding protein